MKNWYISKQKSVIEKSSREQNKSFIWKGNKSAVFIDMILYVLVAAFLSYKVPDL